jgi:hypothetical protein
VATWEAGKLFADDNCDSYYATMRAALCVGAVRMPPLVPRAGLALPGHVCPALDALLAPGRCFQERYASVAEIAAIFAPAL